MTISEWLAEVRRRNPLLHRVAMAHLALACLTILLILIDHRQVMNINAWIKPTKFAISFAIYLMTMGWLLYFLPNQKHARWLSVAMSITMIVEMATIIFQAARGVPSHFNTSSAFNGILFSIMGLFIAVNTLANLAALFLFFDPRVKLDKSFQIAWQFGLLFLFLGSISGGMMVGRLAHTVGAPDGGPGLPFVNWSTVAGDIRVAHFFTLHGFQIIPLAWWFFHVRRKTVQSTGILVIGSLCYLLACIGLHALALEGRPLCCKY